MVVLIEECQRPFAYLLDSLLQGWSPGSPSQVQAKVTPEILRRIYLEVRVALVRVTRPDVGR
jgi:hypothetical protein